MPPPNFAACRAPRIRLTEFTSAVLRLADGGCITGSLEIISPTGGLLCLSKPVNRGSRIKLMFLTDEGPVLGAAELLSPVSWTRQPFRFVALAYADQRRLRAAVQSSLGLNPGERGWIEKYRAMLVHRNRPRRGVFRVVLETLTLLTLCLGSAMYNSKSFARFPWWYSMGCLGWWCLDARQK